MEVNKEHVARVLKGAKEHGCFDNRDDLVAFSTGFAASVAAGVAGGDAPTKKAFDSGYVAASSSGAETGTSAPKMSPGASGTQDSCKGCGEIAWKINAALKPAMAEAGKTKRWHPVEGANFTGLKVRNSLVSNDDTAEDALLPFVVTSPGTVKWYICGPTVYAPSHLGHARAYLTFDIIRGILEEYFGFNVTYAMNVTDIDDKIIQRARENFLYDRWTAQHKTLSDAARKDLLIAATADAAAKAEKIKTKVAEGADEAMIGLIKKQEAEATGLIAAVQSADGASYADVVDKARGALSNWLDKKLKESGEVLKNEIFEALPRKFEKQFFEDMQALGVKPPSVLTRVSEYMPDIVDYVKKIIDNGFAYASNGSVYFDTAKFNARHKYRKLCPPAQSDSKADAALLAEGEGALAAAQTDKKTDNDFALWKRSKVGEPSWESPWGNGRPGWHIECSVMASAVFGENMDIHSGGIDLRFPHHDNEMAQAEAYYQNHQWVNYWFHAGHLHIDGLKMSKSLKNFVTIRKAIDPETGTTTPRALRILFLLNAWDKPLNFSEGQLKQANAIEMQFSKFFQNMKVELRDESANRPKRWSEGSGEQELWQFLHAMQGEIHEDMQNNFRTQPIMTKLQELVKRTNMYIVKAKAHSHPQGYILAQVAAYITRIFKAFGLVGRVGDDWLIEAGSATASKGIGFGSDEGASSKEAVLGPVLDILAKFRAQVRDEAVKGKQSMLLDLCDSARALLLQQGIQLEDRDKKASFKFLSASEKRAIDKEAEQKVLQAKKAKVAKAAKAAKATTAASKDAIPPEMLFKQPADSFSEYNDKGFPTKLADGTVIAKSAAKKLAKQLKAHTKKHKKWLKKQGNATA